jgi:hypothetical protein
METAADAALLFAHFGSDTWNSSSAPKDKYFMVKIPFAIALKPYESRDDITKESVAFRYLAAMRTALSHLRKRPEAKNIKKFSMKFDSWTNHTDAQYLVINLLYTENEIDKNVRKMFAGLEDAL